MESWMIVNLILAGLYFLLLCLCLTQLLRIVYYRHNRASYQSFFLLLCLAWTLLRVLLFALIGHGGPGSWLDLSGWFIRVIYWAPINIQFATFSLLVLFFAQIVHKFNLNHAHRKKFVTAWMGMNALFLIMSVAGLIISNPRAKPAEVDIMFPEASCVLVFSILIVILTYYGWKLDCLIRESRVTLQVKVSSPRQIITLTSVIVVLFTTRCLYDAYSSYTHRSISVVGGDTTNSIIKFIAYFLWEITPLFAVAMFFRNIPKTRKVSISRRPIIVPSEGAPYGSINDSSRTRGGGAGGSIGGRNLFENPNRYDMYEDDAYSSYGSPYLSYTSTGTPTYYHPQLTGSIDRYADSPESSYGSSPYPVTASSYDSGHYGHL